jgi:plastocyanin
MNQTNRRIFWLALCVALAVMIPLHSSVAADKPKARSYAVDINGKGFQPNRLTIKAGDSVSWSNSDSRDHTVSGGGFASGNIKPGGQFSFRFSKPGNYPYSCSLHPRMKGTIVVQP